MLDWFFKHILANPDQASDPRPNLVAANLAGLPPTTIILAQIDPLQDDATGLADKRKAAGVTTDVKEYSGVNHEFFSLDAVAPAAKLKAAFGT